MLRKLKNSNVPEKMLFIALYEYQLNLNTFTLGKYTIQAFHQNDFGRLKSTKQDYEVINSIGK